MKVSFEENQPNVKHTIFKHKSTGDYYVVVDDKVFTYCRDGSCAEYGLSVDCLSKAPFLPLKSLVIHLEGE